MEDREARKALEIGAREPYHKMTTSRSGSASFGLRGRWEGLQSERYPGGSDG